MSFLSDQASYGPDAQITLPKFPYEETVAAGEAMQKRQDKGFDDLDKLAELLPKGGYQTQERAKLFKNQVNTAVNQLADDAYKSNDFADISRRANQLKRQITSSQEYQDIKSDEAVKDYADKERISPDFRNSVQNYFDFDTGYHQTQPGEKFDASWYERVSPGNPQKEFKPYYDQIKAQIDLDYNPAQYSRTIDPNTGDVLVQSIQTGQKVTTITKDQIKNSARNLATNDPNFNALQSFNYAKAYHEKSTQYSDQNGNIQSSIWDPNDNVDLFTDNFLGYFKNTEEIQKIGSKELAAPGVGKSSGGGSGGRKAPASLDNVFHKIIEDVYTPKIQTNTKGEKIKTVGTSSINAKQLAPLIGGEYDTKDQTVNVDLTGRPLFLTTPKQVADDGSNLLNVRKAINLYGDYTKTKEAVKDQIENLPQKTIQYINQKYPGKDIQLDAQNESPAKVYYREGNTSTGKKIYIGKNWIEMQDEYINNIVYKNSPELNQYRVQATALGVNFDSPEFEQKVKRELATSPEVQEFNQKLQAGIINGRVKFSPAKDGDNLITDNEGNIALRGNITVSQEYLETIMPDPWGPGDGWKSLRNKGLIQPNTDGNWIIPITVQANESSDNITRDMQLSFYGSDATTQSLIGEHQQDNRNYLNEKRAEASYNTVKTGLDTGTLKQEDIIKSFGTVEEQHPLVKSTLFEIAKITDKKEKNKELADLWLMEHNLPAWQAIHNKEEKQSIGTNNIGNIRGNNGQFLNYNTVEEGFSAMQNDITIKISGKSKNQIPDGPNQGQPLTEESTLEDMIRIYAPTSDNNNPTQYAKTVADTLGISPFIKLKELQAKTYELSKAMAKVESPSLYNKLFTR